jgi:hypothetical protein
VVPSPAFCGSSRAVKPEIVPSATIRAIRLYALARLMCTRSARTRIEIRPSRCSCATIAVSVASRGGAERPPVPLPAALGMDISLPISVSSGNSSPLRHRT